MLRQTSHALILLGLLVLMISCEESSDSANPVLDPTVQDSSYVSFSGLTPLQVVGDTLSFTVDCAHPEGVAEVIVFLHWMEYSFESQGWIASLEEHHATEYPFEFAIPLSAEYPVLFSLESSAIAGSADTLSSGSISLNYVPYFNPIEGAEFSIRTRMNLGAYQHWDNYYPSIVKQLSLDCTDFSMVNTDSLIVGFSTDSSFMPVYFMIDSNYSYTIDWTSIRDVFQDNSIEVVNYLVYLRNGDQLSVIAYGSADLTELDEMNGHYSVDPGVLTVDPRAGSDVVFAPIVTWEGHELGNAICRWDFNNDGEYDVDWTSSSWLEDEGRLLAYRFESAGDYPLNLRVSFSSYPEFVMDTTVLLTISEAGNTQPLDLSVPADLRIGNLYLNEIDAGWMYSSRWVSVVTGVQSIAEHEYFVLETVRGLGPESPSYLRVNGSELILNTGQMESIVYDMDCIDEIDGYHYTDCDYQFQFGETYYDGISSGSNEAFASYRYVWIPGFGEVFYRSSSGESNSTETLLGAVIGGQAYGDLAVTNE